MIVSYNAALVRGGRSIRELQISVKPERGEQIDIYPWGGGANEKVKGSLSGTVKGMSDLSFMKPDNVPGDWFSMHIQNRPIVCL